MDKNKTRRYIVSAIIIMVIALTICLAVQCVNIVAEREINNDTVVSSNTVSSNIVKNKETEEIKKDVNNLLVADIKNKNDNSTDEESYGTNDNIYFIATVTDILTDDKQSVIKCNTATENGYSGILEISCEDDENKGIDIGNTYKFEVGPMMTMSIPPRVIMVKYENASEKDIETLNNNKVNISNYVESMLNYQNMSLDDIIADSNIQYAIWTDEEIEEFQAFISGLGYNSDYEKESLVKTSEQMKTE